MDNLILFFDTETTGFVSENRALDHPSQPYLVQLAMMLADKDRRVYRAVSMIIRPNNYLIPLEASSVHGITTLDAQAIGTDISNALKWFTWMVNHASLLVAHNILFDLMVMKSQLLRKSLIDENRYVSRKSTYCTMEKTTDLLKLPGKFGKKYKWPKLIELYEYLFNESFDGAHDALEDVRATMRCYFELSRRGI